MPKHTMKCVFFHVLEGQWEKSLCLEDIIGSVERIWMGLLIWKYATESKILFWKQILFFMADYYAQNK